RSRQLPPRSFCSPSLSPSSSSLSFSASRFHFNHPSSCCQSSSTEPSSLSVLRAILYILHAQVPCFNNMPRPTPRIHRLPHRRDYTLIPAPLDLSLPLATEKSSLPAIIVTPSSPISPRDFSIAFLAPPAKPSLCERFNASPFSPLSDTFPLPLNAVNPLTNLRARSLLILVLILFILICHLATHRLAARRPHLEFAVQGGDGQVLGSSMDWFDFDLRSLFGKMVVRSAEAGAGAGTVAASAAAASAGSVGEFLVREVASS
ncbi:hypothetical protein BDQ12DRAFT_162530, partial [Crucibulum laeve]